MKIIAVSWRGPKRRRRGWIVGYAPSAEGVLAIVLRGRGLESVPLRDLTVIGAPERARKEKRKC